MRESSFKETPKFKNPEEELSFLRARLEQKEKEALEAKRKTSPEELTKEVIDEYQEKSPKEVMKKRAVMKEEEVEAVVLRLKPEAHDDKMEELLAIVLEKGISNALSVVERLKSPHIDDDFHRFLVQYLASVKKIPGLKEGGPLDKTLKMKLFEVSLPSAEDEESKKKTLKELLGAMEQFYAGMSSIGEGTNNEKGNRFALEIGLSDNSDNFVFYTAVPIEKSDLFEKLLFGIHPGARVTECPDDYNIFVEKGENVGSWAKFSNKGIFPLKSYDSFEYDPLNIILNIFTKLKKEGEGAAIQLIVSPRGDKINSEFQNILKKVKKGTSLKEATASPLQQIGKEIGSFFNSSSQKEEKKEEKKIDQSLIEDIEEKIKSLIMEVNIRIAVSAEGRERANQILSDLEASFNQFTEADRNSLVFNRPKGRDLATLLRNFSYRIFEKSESIPLNLKEMSTIFHFPQGIVSPQLKEASSGVAPAPLDMDEENGLFLGINNYRGNQKRITMQREDRLRHLYVIGQTGTGKTTIIKNMMIQDIKNGEGCCFIDPHGSDVQDILEHIPKERIDDLIYFDPSYTARPMGLNLLEYDRNRPEQKTLVVNELLSIFNKLFDMKATGGPMFEQYFKNSAFLAMEDTDNQATLLEITRVLSDEDYRNSLLAKCKNPVILEFWRSALQVKGEQALSEFVPYISSKFDNFISNDIMRPVVLQRKSAFNFREIMDNKKILLVNLSKGKLGDLNSNLIGLLLVGKIQIAAMSRADSHGHKLNDFYLYIDEFQNITTDSIASILSEARKYKLSLTIAHQYIDQLEENIKNAVFGNVGSIIAYRVSPKDAEFLEPRFKPTFTSQDIVKLENFNSYVNMLVNGTPIKPFNMYFHYSMMPKGSPETVEKMKELSFLKYGVPLEEIEEEIRERYY